MGHLLFSFNRGNCELFISIFVPSSPMHFHISSTFANNKHRPAWIQYTITFLSPYPVTINKPLILHNAWKMLRSSNGINSLCSAVKNAMPERSPTLHYQVDLILISELAPALPLFCKWSNYWETLFSSSVNLFLSWTLLVCMCESSKCGVWFWVFGYRRHIYRWWLKQSI